MVMAPPGIGASADFGSAFASIFRIIRLVLSHGRHRPGFCRGRYSAPGNAEHRRRPGPDGRPSVRGRLRLVDEGLLDRGSSGWKCRAGGDPSDGQHARQRQTVRRSPSRRRRSAGCRARTPQPVRSRPDDAQDTDGWRKGVCMGRIRRNGAAKQLVASYPRSPSYYPPAGEGADHPPILRPRVENSKSHRVLHVVISLSRSSVSFSPSRHRPQVFAVPGQRPLRASPNCASSALSPREGSCRRRFRDRSRWRASSAGSIAARGCVVGADPGSYSMMRYGRHEGDRAVRRDCRGLL